MPHDRKGRRIDVGDVVLLKGWDGKTHVGEVVKVEAHEEACNIQVAYVQPSVTAVQGTFVSKESELLRKADGSEPAPVGDNEPAPAKEA